MRRLLTAAGLLVSAAVWANQNTPAPFELPAPSGPYAVGTSSWRLSDPSRKEAFTESAQDRQVEVLAWYPAAARRGPAAPYLREGVAEVRAFAALLRAPETAFDSLASVATHAAIEAAPLINGPRFPVLVFSHGYTGIPSSYTALLEDLASHGYAVLSVVHPYEATAATLADGRTVSMLDASGAPRAAVREVFGEWAAEDETMAAVTRAQDPNEQLRLLRGYLAGVRQTGLALKRWVDDTRLVIDRLSSAAPAGLAARLDVGRLGAFGHSMGGVTAAQFCVEDRRCRAALNLDGIPQYGGMIDASMPRAFLMVYSARPGRLGASDAIYRRASRTYYRVDVSDTRHLDFSDMVLWDGPLRERSILGSMPPGRAIDITRAVVRRFFDQELRGRTSALATAMSQFPDVTMRTVPRAGR